MADRAHFQRVRALLEQLDAAALRSARCWFGGGAAVALRCGEFRVSRVVDFLCASKEGYRELRSRVHADGTRGLFRGPVTVVREARSDRYGIRSAIEIDGATIKVEIVSEGRIEIEGVEDPTLPVARLSDPDLVAEKLLANDDRYGDDSGLARDTIDLIILENLLGGLPKEAIAKAVGAYGASVEGRFGKSLERLRARPELLSRWLDLLDVSAEACEIVAARLARQPPLAEP